MPVSFDLLIFSPPTSSQPWAKTCRGSVQVSRHQHRRPEDRVEAQDVLAHQVDVRGPGAGEEVALGRSGSRSVTDGRDVVQQGVEPHVGDLLLASQASGMPQDTLLRDIEMSRSPPFTNATTSLRALGGRRNRGSARNAPEVGRRTSTGGRTSCCSCNCSIGRPWIGQTCCPANSPLARHQVARLLELLTPHAVGTVEGRLVDVAAILQHLPERLHALARADAGWFG